MMGDEGSGFFLAMFSAFYCAAIFWLIFGVYLTPVILSSSLTSLYAVYPSRCRVLLPLDFCCRLVGDWTG
jgi:hypothetical protein